MNSWCPRRFCSSDSEDSKSRKETLTDYENSSNHTFEGSGGIPVFGKEDSDPSQLGKDYVRLVSLLVRMPELVEFAAKSYHVGNSSVADSFDDPEAISRLEKTRAELLARSIAERAGLAYDEIFESIREIEFSNISDKPKFLPVVYIPKFAVDLEQQAELYRCIDSLRTLFTMLDLYGEVPFPCAAWIDGEPVKPSSEADYLREIGSETESPELIRARRQLEDTIIPSRVLRGFEAKLLELRRTARVTRGGTVWSYRAFVVVGNYEGTAGYGMGKSASPRHAVSLAIRDSMKHMIHVERYQDRTIYHPLDFTFKASRVLVFPGRTGKGILSGPLFTVVLTVFGFQDISAKMMGSHNRINTVKALFGALSTHRTVKEVAAIRGVNYLDLGLTNKEETKERNQYMEFL
ncbi:30S ribosomal protein S5 [Galdieria sulphuraria]|nr:30S ribosomal protein S5 [Galdieria sulphuraria]